MPVRRISTFARRLLLLATTVSILAGVAAGCSGDDGEAESANGDVLLVVTTVSPITSIAENIGGTRIRLEGIVPEGINSHTFEPAPSVARLLSQANLIIMNGLALEKPTLDMAEANKKAEAVILLLGDSTIRPDEWIFDFSFPEKDGDPNPHLWLDPMLAIRYGELIRDELSRLDPASAGYYGANFETLRGRIEELDRGIRAAAESVPAQNRKLLTYHDSWAYFAPRYSMTVIGAAQPSDFSEPSAREVARLIDQIKQENVSVVFGSEVFPSDVLETVARESGARYVDQLRDDDLPGKPGDALHSYIGLMLENMRIMIPALGGAVDALQSVDPSLVFGDGPSGAKYP